MHWIIQENLHREEGFSDLVDTLDKFDIPHSVVKVVPFVGDIISETPLPVAGEHVMVIGSLSLAEQASKRGWVPGSFHNENHDQRVWGVAYRGHLLNEEAVVCQFDEVEPRWVPFFIRPCEDTKSFTGQVYFEWAEFAEWRRKVVDLGETYTSLNAATMVAYAPPQIIFREYRFFVVDGKAVTCSTYKVGQRVVYNADVEPAAIEFAQKMVDIYQPARAFVIDVASTQEGYKVVEINCINGAGFYAINVPRFVEAIEMMKF